MKDFMWKWLFQFSSVFCVLLAASLVLAYTLYNTAPSNAYTPVFASAFGFALGFIGLGAFIINCFDKLQHAEPIFEETKHEIMNRVIREMPFFFFALLYFFSLALYMGLFILFLTYIRNTFI
ncbi:MAG: hypothetical protein GX221_06730 [Candidatus Riflebacteria bacterium]|nr:hypothetical protein [Candidatus Riflebacteria bacterium]